MIRLALCVLAAAVVAQPAGGVTVAATPWPVSRIPVWNETAYGRAAADAMDAWTGVGTRVTFVPARSRSSARVVIGRLLTRAVPDQVGQGSLGWSPAARGEVQVVPGLSRRVATTVLAHELGHVLGLEHSPSSCAVMSPVVESGAALDPRCPIGRCAELTRCLVQPVDAAALVELYEQRLPALVPRRVSAVAARVETGTSPRSLVVRWTSPEAGPGGAVLVRAARGRCPVSPYAAPLAATARVDLERGARQEAELPVAAPGPWCARVWVQETSSYLTGPAATVRVVVR